MNHKDFIKNREILAPTGVPSLARMILADAKGLNSSDKQKREDYLREKFEVGGRPFVERVKKFGATEGGDRVILTPWLEELLEGIGDFRLGHTITMACSQLSKAQPLNSKILTPAGWKKMGEIKVGDSVIAADGSATKVLAVHPQGKKEVYEVVFDDGGKTRCCDDHLWLTQTPNERRSKDAKRKLGNVRKLSEIRQTLYRTKANGDLCLSRAGSPNSMHSIQYTQPVSFEKNKNLLLHPYVMGVLLGDGGFTINGQINFTNPEEEIVLKLGTLLPKGMYLHPHTSSEFGYRLSAGVGYHSRDLNLALREIRRQGLEGKYSYEKFIPGDYAFSDSEDRLSLLQGLMDTDGWICCDQKEAQSTQKGNAYYGSSSEQLAKDVWQLVLSLGGNPKPINSSIPKYTHKGEKREGKRFYKFVFSLPDGMNPFSLSRKAKKYVPKDKGGAWYRFIREVQLTGIEECQCITIAHPSHLYITDDYIVTHNSLSHILLAADIQCSGRLVFAYVYDRKQSLENMQGSQFRPCLNYWLESMEDHGIVFDRTRDVIKSTRCMVQGVVSVYTYASTSDQNLRDGKSAVGSAAASFKADVVFLEERSQYPPGAADIFYRRLDYSAVDTKPIRELSTPGAGGGIEVEIRNVDYHFYPHAECDNCGHVFPLDAYGCLLKKFLRTDAYGQQVEAYVSESNRPVEWFYKDPQNPVQTAYFACPNCEEELGEETRINARFKCLKTGQWFRDVVDSLPKGIPNKRIKAVFGYGPLLRKSKINLAADLIRNGLEMVDPADWIQQGLGHPSEAGSSVLTIPVLKRAIDAPPAERIPEIRLAGVDQGRGSYWLTIADISLPEGWKELAVEVVIEKAVRSIVFAGDVMVGALADKLTQYRVGYGFIDNEPNRTIAAELQRTTVLEMADQRSRLGDALKKDTVQEGGMDISCWLIRNEKFLMQTMLTFLLSDENNNPLIRLPKDWTRWIANPSERSPLRHYMGVKYDPSNGDWIKTDPVNDLFYSLAFMEAALYSWLMSGAKDIYVPGGLTTTKAPEDKILGSFVNRSKRRNRLRRSRPY